MKRIREAQQPNPGTQLDRTGRGFSLIAHRKFLSQIIKQCLFAIRAYEAMDIALARMLQQVGPRSEDDQEVFEMSLQSFLIAAASVSRMLWESGKSSPLPERPTRLRHMLAVDDGSSLKNRDLRNFFEHYEDRLDHWVMGKASRDFDALYAISISPDRDDLGFLDYEVGDDNHGIPLRPVVRALIALKAKAEVVRSVVSEHIEAAEADGPQSQRERPSSEP